MKEKGSVKKALLKVLALMAEDEMEVNIYSWPPICAGILHQPERPNNRIIKENKNEKVWSCDIILILMEV